MTWLAEAGAIESPASRRAGLSRFFFTALALSYVVVAVAGFGPNVVSYHAGRLELSWAAIVHGVMMSAWLLLLTVQASLPALGRLQTHRRLGVWVGVFAFVIWVSMIAVSVRQMAVRNPPEGHFLLNILLLQIQAALLFPIFVFWAIAEKRRPAWHKRLMVFAMVAPLGAAVDRMLFLPVAGVEGQWPLFLYLDLLLVPLLIFDLTTLRRLHPATVLGCALLLITQVAVTLLWDHPLWHRLAFRMVSAL
jgi:hypothetical protein